MINSIKHILKFTTRLMIILIAASWTVLDSANVSANENSNQLIQLSGLVTNVDTSAPIPFATVRIKNERRGTVANMEGFYTFVVEPGDTVRFSAMGFAGKDFVVPKDIERDGYRHVQPLPEDTLMLEEQLIYPWPTREQFNRAFLRLDLEDDMKQHAERNLQRELLREISSSLAMDGREAQTMELHLISREFARSGGQTNYYYTPGGGTPVPTSVLDPTAWYELIESIQRGDFRRD